MWVNSNRMRHTGSNTVPAVEPSGGHRDLDRHNAENRTTGTDNNDDNTALVVYRTLNDVARRKRNIIMTGLPESNEVDDRTAFEQLCEMWLPIKPALAEDSCKRVGQQQPGRPRRLLVHLSSEETAADLLHAAPWLRQSSDGYIAENVYFNADLSRAAAKLAYEQRQQRRESQLRRRRASYNNTGNNGSVAEDATAVSAPAVSVTMTTSAASAATTALDAVGSSHVADRTSADVQNQPVGCSSQAAASNTEGQKGEGQPTDTDNSSFLSC
jgi:hypothetical protein